MLDYFHKNERCHREHARSSLCRGRKRGGSAQCTSQRKEYPRVLRAAAFVSAPLPRRPPAPLRKTTALMQHADSSFSLSLKSLRFRFPAHLLRLRCSVWLRSHCASGPPEMGDRHRAESRSEIKNRSCAAGATLHGVGRIGDWRLPIRPASRRPGQAGRLCYPHTGFGRGCEMSGQPGALAGREKAALAPQAQRYMEWGESAIGGCRSGRRVADRDRRVACATHTLGWGAGVNCPRQPGVRRKRVAATISSKLSWWKRRR